MLLACLLRHMQLDMAHSHGVTCRKKPGKEALTKLFKQSFRPQFPYKEQLRMNVF